jgi:phosphinothricin acetyltransferase
MTSERNLRATIDHQVRQGRASDMPALTDLYNHYVLTSPATFDVEPETIQTRLEWFSHYSTAGPHRVFVAVLGDQVLGFASSSRLAERAAYGRAIESSVYVRFDALGRGIGTRLYSALFSALGEEEEAVHRAYAQVTLPNAASCALHRRFDFHAIGLQHEVGHKFGRYWSVQLFEKRLD